VVLPLPVMLHQFKLRIMPDSLQLEATVPPSPYFTEKESQVLADQT